MAWNVSADSGHAPARLRRVRGRCLAVARGSAVRAIVVPPTTSSAAPGRQCQRRLPRGPAAAGPLILQQARRPPQESRGVARWFRRRLTVRGSALILVYSAWTFFVAGAGATDARPVRHEVCGPNVNPRKVNVSSGTEQHRVLRSFTVRFSFLIMSRITASSAWCSGSRSASKKLLFPLPRALVLTPAKSRSGGRSSFPGRRPSLSDGGSAPATSVSAAPTSRSAELAEPPEAALGPLARRPLPPQRLRLLPAGTTRCRRGSRTHRINNTFHGARPPPFTQGVRWSGDSTGKPAAVRPSARNDRPAALRAEQRGCAGAAGCRCGSLAGSKFGSFGDRATDGSERPWESRYSIS